MTFNFYGKIFMLFKSAILNDYYILNFFFQFAHVVIGWYNFVFISQISRYVPTYRSSDLK